MMIINNRNREI